MMGLFPKPKDTDVHVCADCGGEIEQKGPSGDSLNWCDSCQQLEGSTKYVTVEEFEALHE